MIKIGLGHHFVRGAVRDERPIRFECLLSDTLFESEA